MIAILTADIINSGAYSTSRWMELLKTSLSRWGDSPADWEIYRGDELQLRTHPERALKIAIELKARIKTVKGLDIRIAIGLGEEDFKAAGVSESNGSAYRRSGRMLEELKSRKKKMGLDSGSSDYNRTFNLLIDLASDFMDGWSPVSAEMVAVSLSHAGINQTEMAKLLKIKQSAVSQRQKRARLSLINDLLDYYHQTIKDLKAT